MDPADPRLTPGAGRFRIEERPGLSIAVHDGVALRGDAYLPDGPGPFPGFVLLHGGAFTKGSRASYAPWGRFLASHGYVALSADYRLATGTTPTFPACIFDAKAAVQFLRGSATELRLDPDRIGVMGGSAGGYLAAMVGLTSAAPGFANPYDDPHATVRADVSVVVPMAGIFDLSAQWEHDRTARPPGPGMTEVFIGGTPLDSRRRYYEASPLFHVDTANARGTRWLIGWGTHDDVVPPAAQSERLAHDLKLTDAVVRLAPLVGAPHYWYMEEGPAETGSFNAQFAGRLLAFLRTWSGWDAPSTRKNAKP